jgi:hypothetical protein
MCVVRSSCLYDIYKFYNCVYHTVHAENSSAQFLPANDAVKYIFQSQQSPSTASSFFPGRARLLNQSN